VRKEGLSGNLVELFNRQHWSRLRGGAACNVSERFLSPYVGDQPYRR
jgi:hypothetical protein